MPEPRGSPTPSAAPSPAERVAGVVVGGMRAVVRALPARWKKLLDDRIFGAIFQMTRVTNDAYGWRPTPENGQGKKDEHEE